LTIEKRPPIPKAAQRMVVQTVALIQHITPQPVKVKPAPLPPPAPTPEPEVVEAGPITAEPETPSGTPIEPPKPKQTPQPKPKPRPQPKKTEKKKQPVAEKKAKPAPIAEKKKVETKPKPVDRAQIKNRELLAKAQESIAKIKASSGTIGAGKTAKRSELQVPQLEAIPKIGEEEMAGWSIGEVGYRDELASRLKLQLRLPEYGEVKVKLTLARVGRFVKVFIVSSESKTNRQYIEKTIPTLTFPPFGQHFDNKDEYTFSITLSNDL
jgi:hypothetical protein